MSFWLYIVLTLIVIAVVYCLFFKKKEEVCPCAEQSPAAYKNTAELRRYQHLRSIHLSEPLTERVRPKSFAAIIGQQEGIAALKAALASANPQHIIIYGPPGVGKTAAARLALDYAKSQPQSPFAADAPFIEIDGATARFDERGIADPLLGSVHDPIYQGAGALGSQGVPQPKEGAVNHAHGGVLFIDEIGELHNMQINKLLKVLEDRRIMPESAYYNPCDKNIPEYIHDLFANGLPADFRLIGATTKHAEELPEALRSRCIEIYFNALQASEIGEIAVNAARELELGLSEGTLETICRYANSGRDAVNMLQLAKGLSDNIVIKPEAIERIAQVSHYIAHQEFRPFEEPQIGRCYALLHSYGGNAVPVCVEAEAFEREHGQLIISASDSNNATMEILKGIVMKAVTAIRAVSCYNTDDYDIHINFELNDAIADGTLALAAACAIASACSGRALRPEILLCGKLSICGKIIPLDRDYCLRDFMLAHETLKLLCGSDAYAGYIKADTLASAMSRVFVPCQFGHMLDIHAYKEKLRLQAGGPAQ